jgi:hypothetical protein
MALSHSNSALAKRLTRHFAACATVAAASPFLATELASADVIYNQVAMTVPANIDGLYINVETLTTGSSGASTAGWDINPYSATSLTWFNATGTGMMRYPGVTTGSAGNLAPGTIVSATASFGSGAVVVGAAAGNWQLNSANYFGFRFVAADGQTHYGWGRFEIGAAINGADRTITELAWESAPGVAITVGDTGGGSGPYDPCAPTNPGMNVGSNNLFVRNTDIADLDLGACGTLYKANYYKFTAPATRNYDFSTCAGSGASSLAILDGCAAGSNVVACGSACGASGSTVTLAATAGSVYYIVLGSSVSGVDLASPYGVSVTPWYDPCDPANPTAGNGTGNLAYNNTTSEDISTSCGVIYNANAYKYTPSESGSYTINTCSGGLNTRIAVLDGCAAGSAVLACNDDFCGGSSSITLDLIGTVPVYIVVGSNSSKSVLTGPVAVTVIPPPLPACVDAVAASYGANAFDNTASTSAQTAKSNLAGTTTGTINKAMWFTFTPTATGQFKIDMCGATGDTIIAIGDVCPAVGGRFEGLAYNDDACLVAGSTTSNLASCMDATNCGATGSFAGFPLAQDLVAGTTYYICAGSFSATANITGVLNIEGPASKGNPADLDGDGVVGPQDLATLLGNWGNPGAGDIDGDGQVGAADLAALLGAWS